MFKTLFAFILSLCCLAVAVSFMANGQSVPRESADNTGMLVGTVVDEYERVPISTAFVVVYREKSSSSTLIRTNVKGYFEAKLPPGHYDVLVGSGAFAPSCKRIEVLSGQRVEFNTKLHPDFENLEQATPAR